MDLNNIIGQKEIVSSLKNSIKSERVGHAYIFSGPKGVGKRTVAKIFAGLLQCEKPDNGKICGECFSCSLLVNSSNPDLKLIETSNASISVDEIRKIQGDVNIKPLYSQRKLYVIVDAEKMTAQAQNCLLKTLEEPPEYTVIILTTSNYDALVGTIRSRAVRYNFKKNTYSEVRSFLQMKNGESLKNLEFITAYADGVIGTALELTESEEFAEIREKTLKIILRIKNSKLLDIFDVYEFFEVNKDSINTILDIMLLFYRDIIVLKETGKENILINYDKKDIILSNVLGFSMRKLMKSIETIELTRKNIKQNANYQLSIEVMLMKLQED